VDVVTHEMSHSQPGVWIDERDSGRRWFTQGELCPISAWVWAREVGGNHRREPLPGGARMSDELDEIFEQAFSHHDVFLDQQHPVGPLVGVDKAVDDVKRGAVAATPLRCSNEAV